MAQDNGKSGSPENQQPIIVIKKKGGHGGHHGGAWKVAYADFVTAMMSLFIVLWLMSSTSKQTQEEIAGYFRDPKGTSSKHGADPKPQETKEKKDDMAGLKNDLLKAIKQIDALNKLGKQIEITVTPEGLRIEMLEDAKGTFFEVGSAQPTPVLNELLKVLAEQLKVLPNSISIEGHTDARPYSVGGAYGNWELSTDRANVARREMQADGIRVNQISQVRGFADQRLHLVDKPFDPANRRVSLVVQNLNREEELLGTAKMVAERNEAEQKRGTSANVKAQRGGEEKPGKGSASPAEALATAETTKQTAAAGAALLEKSER